MARERAPAAGNPGVEVFGEYELLDRLERGVGHFRACISIGNPRSFLRAARPGERLHPLVRSSFDRVLRLSFYDLEEPARIEGLAMDRLPALRDARRVVRFFERTRGWTDGWTIHCWAGVSRSAAVALGLLYLIHGDEARAAAELRRLRPIALPNRGLLRHFDALLGSRLAEASDGIRSARLAELKLELDDSLEELGGADRE